MRLNGTYLDRLLVNVLPFTLIATIISHFVKKNTITSDLILLTTVTFVFWAIDSIIIYFKHLKTLRIDNAIHLDNNQVSAMDILEITTATDSRRRWEFKTIHFKIQKDGLVETISIMEKPMTLIENLIGKKSKTLGPLFTKFPELKEKLKSSE